MRSDRTHDVVIIGGGPAGAAAGTLLARAGHDVALFERRAFPRFMIGESMVPAVNLTLERLGLLAAMPGTTFPRKHGVQFFSPAGPGKPFYFSETRDERTHSTWQVLRSDFDRMVLDHAVAAGVKAEMRAEVTALCSNDERVEGIEVKTESGASLRVAGRVVLDASGQRGLIARRLGGRTHIEGLENASVYAHYEGVRRDEGIDAGSTLIFRLEGGPWLWFIPLPDVVSIGLVAPARDIWSFGGSPAEILETAIAACPPLAERLKDATRTNEARAVRDYSYRATVDAGRGWALIGDALGFIDPMYSTGLCLSLASAELAADAVDTALRAGEGSIDVAGFSAPYQEAFDRFLILVRAFYRDDFHFGALAKDAEMRQGLVDMLTGIVDTPEAMAVTDAIRASLDPAAAG